MAGLAGPGPDPARVTPGVVRGDPLEPAQHVRDVGAEHAAVAVALVHDHVLETAEELAPARVPRQQHVVEHVGRGEQVVRPGPGPLPVGGRGVAVHHGRAHPGDTERLHRPDLVRRESPGGGYVEDRAPAQHGGERGQQVAKRLAGGGRGGDDHVPAMVRVFGHGRLMRPGSGDTGPGQRLGDPGRYPAGPRDALPRTGRNLLDVHEPAVPHATAQDTRRGDGVPSAGMPHARFHVQPARGAGVGAGAGLQCVTRRRQETASRPAPDNGSWSWGHRTAAARR